LYEIGSQEALYEISRKKPILANRVDASIEKAVSAPILENIVTAKHRCKLGRIVKN